MQLGGKQYTVNADGNEVIEFLRAKLRGDGLWIAICAAFVAAGAENETAFGRWAVVFGLVFGIVAFFRVVIAWRQSAQWHKLLIDEYKARNFPQELPTQQAQPIEQLPDRFVRTADEPNRRRYERIQGEEMPPREFIVWLYATMGSGQIWGEDRIETETEWKNAGQYLRAMARLGFIAGRDHTKRKPGRLQGNVGDCLECFYGDSTLPVDPA